MKMNKYLSGLIRKRRKSLKMDQEILAQYAGISVWSLSKIETGDANPTISTIESIMDILGLDLIVQVKNSNKPYEG